MVTEKVTQDVCFGCGACVVACPNGSLSLETNEKGFLVPTLSRGCHSCSTCESVCPVLHPPKIEAKKVEVFAAFSLSKNVRLWSSSGGVFLALGLRFIQGGQVAGVVFDDDFRYARHAVASDSRWVLRFCGSKYVQSDPVLALREIRDSRVPILFSGTPCQIAGLKNLIAQGILRGDFLLVDLFCHGVPSYLLWWSYLDFLKKKVGRILHVEQRLKIRDWHRYYFRIFGDRGVYLKEFTEDPFMFFYLRNYFLRECCYQCPFRELRSCADLRLGDFWGQLFAQENLGTSIVVTFTEKGFRSVVEDEDIFLQSMPVEVVSMSQVLHIPKPVDAVSVFSLLQCGMSIEEILRRRFRWEWQKTRIRKAVFFLLDKNPYLRTVYKLAKHVLRG